MCSFCGESGKADESTIDGWIKVDCPVCNDAEDRRDKATLAADFRAEIESIKAAIGTPAWR